MRLERNCDSLSLAFVAFYISNIAYRFARPLDEALSGLRNTMCFSCWIPLLTTDGSFPSRLRWSLLHWTTFSIIINGSAQRIPGSISPRRKSSKDFYSLRWSDWKVFDILHLGLYPGDWSVSLSWTISCSFRCTGGAARSNDDPLATKEWWMKCLSICQKWGLQ